MSVRPIRLLGDPVLRRVAKPVERWEESLDLLARDMIDTMRAANGVGLAAPQIGKSVALFVAQLPRDIQEMEPLILANPEILAEEGAETAPEGCLSIPGIEEDVERPFRIRVRGLSPSGTTIERDAEDYLARVIQHEIDHLKGILFIDRLSPLKRRLLKRQLDEIRSRADGDRSAPA